MKEDTWRLRGREYARPIRVVETEHPDGRKFVHAEWADSARPVTRHGQNITEYRFDQFDDGVNRFVGPVMYRSVMNGYGGRVN